MTIPPPSELAKGGAPVGARSMETTGIEFLKAIWRAIRPYQWVKNLLIFVPLLTSHQLLNPTLFGRAVLAALAFSLCASAVYVINDVLDVEADRRHPRKRLRPFAAGDLSLVAGPPLAVVLLLASLAIGLMLPIGFLSLLGVYVLATTAYSARFKREPVVDVLVLAGLYALRVLVGGKAVDVDISAWLLAFASFFFLSLAFVKRFSELRHTSAHQSAASRGYRPDDAGWVQASGLVAGYLAILVLALYISSVEVAALYDHPRRLWLACPILLYWLTRLWFRAHRGEIHDDPIIAALTDRASYACAAATGGVLLAAL